MSMRAVGPRYAEIANELKQRILSGLYSQTGFLPQERQLSEEFGVSRCTLRSALECLQEEKLICKIQGCGNRIVAGTSALPRYIGILTYGIGSVSRFVNVMLQEIEHFVRDRGQITLLLNLESDSESSIQDIQNRLRKQKDMMGLLLVGCYPRPLLRRLEKMIKLPAVLFGDVFGAVHRLETPALSQVVGNDYSKMYQAVDYLLQQGLTRPGILGEPVSEIWGYAWHQGCRDAFADHQKEHDPDLYIFTDGYQDPESLLQNASRLLKKFFSGKNLPDSLVFLSELTPAVRLFQADHPELMKPDFPLVGLSNDGEPRDFPCLSVKPSDMVGEAFDLLEREWIEQRHLHLRKEVLSTWINLPDRKPLQRIGKNFVNDKNT